MMRLENVPTPAYVIDEGTLIRNLEILKGVMDRTGCKILLAQKAFSAFCVYPLIGQYLTGTTASGLFEAMLAHEEMKKENHVFAPAFKKDEIPVLADICDHIVMNSFSQLKQHKDALIGKISIGLRINPECSTQDEHAIYDPCAPGSRLGITLSAFEKAVLEEPELLDHVEGLHFHTLCEQNSDDLLTTWKVVKEKFDPYLKRMKWLNMGGGHHITRDDYDIALLEEVIRDAKKTYNVEVYLEPGEAIALKAGWLVTEVLDYVENGITTLLLDTSAECHMPDVLEMPYRPPLRDSGEANEKAFTYRLSSCSCLAGDVIGDYSFDREIVPGDRLYFEDMAIYSMVKNNTFNGLGLPSIYVCDPNGDCRLIRKFGYEDFKMRLS